MCENLGRDSFFWSFLFLNCCSKKVDKGKILWPYGRTSGWGKRLWLWCTMIFFFKGSMSFFFTNQVFFGGGGMGGGGCGTRWPSAYEDTSSQVDGHLVPYPRSHISKWRLVKKKCMSMLYIVKSISSMKIIVIAQERGGGGGDGRPPTKIHPSRRTT